MLFCQCLWAGCPILPPVFLWVSFLNIIPKIGPQVQATLKMNPPLYKHHVHYETYTAVCP